MVYSIQQNGYLVYHKYYDRFKFILGLIYESYKLVIDKINIQNFTVFLGLPNGVGLELFMSLLKIFCFFDLDFEDLVGETSAE